MPDKYIENVRVNKNRTYLIISNFRYNKEQFA